ncbi:hypothetical protein SUGI_0537750 [Cryptomeria japonica]|nr:hypothetical protein SUGI_0537750 [Cryptomeria japonica]
MEVTGIISLPKPQQNCPRRNYSAMQALVIDVAAYEEVEKRREQPRNENEKDRIIILIIRIICTNLKILRREHNVIAFYCYV